MNEVVRGYIWDTFGIEKKDSSWEGIHRGTHVTTRRHILNLSVKIMSRDDVKLYGNLSDQWKLVVETVRERQHDKKAGRCSVCS